VEEVFISGSLEIEAADLLPKRGQRLKIRVNP
jgi:hypothetical protein